MSGLLSPPAPHVAAGLNIADAPFNRRMRRLSLSTYADCLRQFWPLLLGSGLPLRISTPLLDGLLEPSRFRTAPGFAAESPRSPFHKPDGYWLGPVWVPSTYQVVEMLRLNDKPDEAAQTMLDF